MIDVQVKRAEAPIEQITITMDAETAKVVKYLCGFGTSHISDYGKQPNRLVPGLSLQEAQEVGHSISRAINHAAGWPGL